MTRSLAGHEKKEDKGRNPFVNQVVPFVATVTLKLNLSL